MEKSLRGKELGIGLVPVGLMELENDEWWHEVDPFPTRVYTDIKERGFEDVNLYKMKVADKGI